MPKKKKKPDPIKVTNICVFEDDQVSSFEPLHYFHPIWELTLGTTSLCEKVFRAFPTLFPSVSCREELAPILSFLDDVEINALEPGDYLFINARLAEPQTFQKMVEPKGPATFFVQDNTIIGARIRLTETFEGNVFKLLTSLQDSVAKEETSFRLYSHVWDLIDDNPKAVSDDAKFFPLGKRKGAIYATTVLVNPKQIYLPETSAAGPGVVLDASNGPVIIDDNVEIMPNTFIQGPAYIGEGSTIKAGSMIYGGTSIGHTCKIGGEVEESIFLPFSNKQHYGFIGHSYIGGWCNLGAGTTNSDLKNTYSKVKVPIGGKQVETGKQFVGLFMGDHVKSGINTMFNTGSVIGPVSSVFGAGFQPKYLPPFSWNDAQKKPEIHRFEKALETATRTMKRRDQNVSKEYQDYFLKLFKKRQTSKTV